MKKAFLFLAAISFFIFACDKVDLPQQQHTVVVPTSDTIRKILVEEFTGHTCIYCAAGARTLDSLQQLYPSQIICVAIHYDFYAEPCISSHLPPAGSLPGTFTEDFRALTEDGDYTNFFQANNFTLPSALINRYNIFPSYSPQGAANWPTVATNILDTAMTAYIKLHPVYDAVSRALTVSVTGEFMHDTTGTYNIALYLVEDGLHGSQTDTYAPGGILNNYTFNNVFRGCINSPGTIVGAQIANGTITNGQAINYNMSSAFTVNNAYNDLNCKVVGFLYKTSDQGVLQAAECNLR
jgi:thiol-disulfide isomerase/thioredoxin